MVVTLQLRNMPTWSEAWLDQFFEALYCPALGRRDNADFGRCDENLFPKTRVPIWGPHDNDSSILVFILRKVPTCSLMLKIG